jgi:protein SCO1/2
MTSQDGERVNLRNLVGRPMAVSFLYTRCENVNKCPLVATTLARLQEDVERAGLGGSVRLVLVTYDPAYDTPDRLKEYGAGHGLRFTGDTLMLRPDPAAADGLFRELRVAVNYDATRAVNVHGLQLILIDRRGRHVRTYHTLIWDNARVLEDLKSLVAEGEPGERHGDGP